MCDVEEFISGHQLCSDGMDLYITDSLQDMLDMDIKSEMATDLASANDFSDTLGMSMSFSDMPSLLDMEADNAATWVTNSSSFVHNLDLYGSEANAVMVNPNSVMPSTFSEATPKKAVNENSTNPSLNSTKLEKFDSPTASPTRKSHLTFSPHVIKVPKVKEEEDTTDKLEEATQMFIYVRKDSGKDSETESKRLKVNSTQSPPVLRIKSQSELLKLNHKNSSVVSTKSSGAKTIISGNIHILGAQQSRTILNGGKGQAFLIDNGLSLNNTRQLIKTSVSNSYSVPKYSNKRDYLGEFPKPAYSYSCLIAMALKNSRTGSLPVSEIYNFMCQHFPYFKTAPNGWKNSVRHNLSLNKCFEKIEKPSTNGGQRKGCLWAMNPSKVEKMDEEVQKWSRKDPQAIRKAMVHPDNLEALERGEMKYSGGEELDEGDGDGDSDHDDTDGDGLDDQEELSEQELEVEEVVEGTGMVGGTYRLMAGSRHNYLSDGSGDEASDVEVLDGQYDDMDMELGKHLKVEFAVSEDYEDNSSKRSKNDFIYQPPITATHTSRRKTPLVNRNYKIC